METSFFSFLGIIGSCFFPPRAIEKIPGSNSIEVIPFPTVNLEPNSPKRDPWSTVSVSKQDK